MDAVSKVSKWEVVAMMIMKNAPVLKALTLYQPWATLVACGLKRIETRGRRMSYQGPLVIHAGMRWTTEERNALQCMADRFPQIEEAFRRYRFAGTWAPPLGCVVAVTCLVACYPMTAELIDRQSDLELAVGRWELGRYALTLGGVCAIKPWVFTPGSRGLWNLKTAELRSRDEATRLLAAWEVA